MIDLIAYLEKTHNLHFNPQQHEALFSKASRLLLLAVPGSGKTTVLVSRIANLLLNHNVAPKKVLTLTFSRESAKDMEKRFSSLFCEIVDTPPKFSTIHSFCYHVLAFYSKTYNRQFPKLIDGNGIKTKLLREIHRELNGEYLTDDVLESLTNSIGYVKNTMLTKAEILSQKFTPDNFYDIFQNYEQVKKQENFMDFDDMLCFCLDIFKKLPTILSYFQQQYDYIHIDEAQDTSKLQHEIIGLLAKNANLFMVGDEDQCIYSFRGAYPEGLTHFGKIYPNATILKIEQNYRSNSDIVSLSNEFIKINHNRYDKNMVCDNTNKNSVSVVSLDDYNSQSETILKEIKQLPTDKTLAVLYRNNESAIPLIDILHKHGISYYIKEHNLRFFTSFVVKDILAYLALAKNGRDIDAFEKIYYKFKCSKLIFLYVKANLHRFKSVFDAAMAYKDCPIYLKKKLIEYEYHLKKLARKRPSSAINTIETKLGYGEFLKQKGDVGVNSVNGTLKLSIIKTIAKNTDTIEEFVGKLAVLEDSIISRENVSPHANITLSSIHSSKGLEFDTVILCDFIENIIPTKNAIDEYALGKITEMESEARLFYVGVTRAKKKLVILTSKYFNDEYILQSRFITRFLNEKKPPKKLKSVVEIEVILEQRVVHKHFGPGQVVFQDGDTIKIDFPKHGVKTLSYTFCHENGVLRQI